MPRDASLLMPAEAAAAMAAELGHPMLVIELLRKDRLQVTAAELLGLHPFGDDPGPGNDEDNPLSPSGFLYSIDINPTTTRPFRYHSPVNVWRIRVDFNHDTGDARWTLLRVK